MKKAKCPKCGSTALYVPCSVSARYDYNSVLGIPYHVDIDNIDNAFLNSVTCKKCGNVCDETELVY